MISYIIVSDEKAIEFLKKNASKITGNKKEEVVVESINSLAEVENVIAKYEGLAERDENKSDVSPRKRNDNKRKHTTQS